MASGERPIRNTCFRSSVWDIYTVYMSHTLDLKQVFLMGWKTICNTFLPFFLDGMASFCPTCGTFWTTYFVEKWMLIPFYELIATRTIDQWEHFTAKSSLTFIKIRIRVTKTHQISYQPDASPWSTCIENELQYRKHSNFLTKTCTLNHMYTFWTSFFFPRHHWASSLAPMHRKTVDWAPQSKPAAATSKGAIIF